MRRRSSFSESAALLAAAAAAGALVAACGSRSKPAPDGGAPAETVASASAASASAPDPSAGAAEGSSDAGANGDGGAEVDSSGCPDFDRSRWTAYAGYDYQYRCWVSTPTSKELMPRPYVWEPCEREEFGPKCRRIKLAPRESLSFGRGGETRTAIVSGRAPAKIEIARKCPASKLTVYSIAEVDGPTQVAVAADADYPCEFHAWTKREGYVLEATSQRRHETQTDDYNQPVMVPVDLPRAMLAYGSVTPKLIGGLELTGLRPKALANTYLKGGADTFRGMRVPEKRQPVFVGGDGNDLVWSFPTADDPAQCELLRAPFKDDPAALEPPTRVGVFPCKNIQSNVISVGCGMFGATTKEGEAIVVRMKDGLSFHFPKLCGPLDRDETCRTRALGFSCSEAFFGVGGPKPNVFRVPLDALPGGTPAKEPPRPFEEAAAAAPEGDAGATDAGGPDAAPTGSSGKP